MIWLSVHAESGRYRKPGALSVLQKAKSFPIAPPSTMRGFLHSMCGKYRSDLDCMGSRFAYGWIRRPLYKGNILTKDQMYMEGANKDPTKPTFISRPISYETFFDMEYGIYMEGPYEVEIKKYLNGEVKRTGHLYLGHSDNVINYVCEIEPTKIEWVDRGHSFFLTTDTPSIETRNYSNIRQRGEMFSLSSPSDSIPNGAYFELFNNL